MHKPALVYFKVNNLVQFMDYGYEFIVKTKKESFISLYTLDGGIGEEMEQSITDAFIFITDVFYI